MEDEKITFLMPKNVRTRFELFPGFGIREILLVFAGALFGGFVGLILYLVTSFVPVFIAIFIFGGFGFVLGKQDPRTGKAAIDQIRDFQEFNRKPRQYFYRFGDGRK